MEISRAVDSPGISVCPKRFSRTQLIVVDMMSHIIKIKQNPENPVSSEHFPLKTIDFKIIVKYFFFVLRVGY